MNLKHDDQKIKSSKQADPDLSLLDWLSLIRQFSTTIL
ncbi:hypothetical protein EJK55_1808 [Moraxella catarrhalis]|uniref:Uncharacterized protein n=1 Tax=Moraxella catarrhalis TaxID=480 RepID=A0A3S9QCX7_MORCA|nr:hypothetical protein MCR_1379 [Moraxella catarrhalis BBH18]AZQ87151.1 hypothetical protein EJK52_1433 [Moraxella catarrhalis]EKF83338.1 hypothetical protein MCRH_1458 [Moraxella catarrhalis RH4]AZQ90247.1 hypothetical protein EJK50_1500 [Moraxella catarrhalis]AZQ90908.1 hypothetical protein EJK51_1432 [Moraxella catarrhalis]